MKNSTITPLILRSGRRAGTIMAMCAMLFAPAFAIARTIVIDTTEADKMAVLSDIAPRMSWAATEVTPTIFNAGSIDLAQGKSFLIRYNLRSIPPGQRITYAELLLPLRSTAGTDPRFYLWRILADWGLGVCHLYRFTYPARQEWAVPGARGFSSDRATRPSAVVRVTSTGELALNVTEDVELWYTGAAPHFGWLFTVEDPETMVRFSSPAWDAVESWRIRITYEPE